MAEAAQQQPAAAAGTLALGGEETVNRMGFGAMRITGPGVWGEPPDLQDAKRVLRRAVELGVNFIDTADAYGPEVSERLIAEALAPYPDGLVIGTKGGLTRSGPGQWERDGRPEHLREACDASLRRLGVERIDVYQLHAVDSKVPLEESVGALSELRDAGKVHHVGLCNVSLEELDAARRIVPVVSVQTRYSVAERDSEPLVDACEADGLAFIPWFPLGAGDVDQRLETLRGVADDLDATPFQVALAWLLHRSPAMLPIPGTSSAEHLEEDAAAASLRLSDEQMRALEG